MEANLEKIALISSLQELNQALAESRFADVIQIPVKYTFHTFLASQLLIYISVATTGF